MTETQTIRKPAVSGSFYPSDPAALEVTIRDLVDKTDYLGEVGIPKALIVPHAGYAYSGQVTASAFSLLAHRDCSIHRIVLLGPSHHFSFDGLAASSANAFATPLGDVRVADDLSDALEEFPFVKKNDTIHAPEHSIEVELPFLQVVLAGFSLVPLVTGDASAEQVSNVLEHLWGRSDTLIIISTDLSHFHDYTAAMRLDAFTCKVIEALDYEVLHGNLACGFVALRGMLLAAKRQGLSVRTLKLTNSGDITGNHNRVVGYGAWAFYDNT